MFYYLEYDKLLISPIILPGFPEVSETKARGAKGMVYFLCERPPENFRRSFAASDTGLPFLTEEGINLLMKPEKENDQLPIWLREKIYSGFASVLNIAYPNWQNVFKHTIPDLWKVNIAGLGDVGGTLLTGLRLLGGKKIGEIGIYDQDSDKINRWDYEGNQILSPFDDIVYPHIKGISQEEVFDCDLFVFCISAGVPPLGQEGKDVRLAQFEGNARIINSYAQMAREKGFSGVFAVVSDPVDLLCKSAFLASNTDEKGNKDYYGLAPEQIRGYGLGVMNARAAYFAGKREETASYSIEGRAYGPHGEGLVIANSIENYDARLSEYLTHKAKRANIDVRNFGYKPYVAPALSSGALALLATIEGKWHYSATFMGGVFMGAKNRLTCAGTEVERLLLPDELKKKIQVTYELLGSW